MRTQRSTSGKSRSDPTVLVQIFESAIDPIQFSRRGGEDNTDSPQHALIGEVLSDFQEADESSDLNEIFQLVQVTTILDNLQLLNDSLRQAEKVITINSTFMYDFLYLKNPELLCHQFFKTKSKQFWKKLRSVGHTLLVFQTMLF